MAMSHWGNGEVAYFCLLQGLELRVVILLDWLPTKATEPSLTFIRFGICVTVNITLIMVTLTLLSLYTNGCSVMEAPYLGRLLALN